MTRCACICGCHCLTWRDVCGWCSIAGVHRRELSGDGAGVGQVGANDQDTDSAGLFHSLESGGPVFAELEVAA